MKLKTFLLVAGAAAALAITGQASAAPITYTFTGVGTGELDGTSFTDFTVTLTGDTAAVQPPGGPGGEYFNDAISAIVTANGVTDSFTGTSLVGDNPNPADPAIAFGNLGNGVVFEALQNSAFASYDLTTALSSTGGAVSGQAGDISTVNGLFHLDEVSSMTFSAAVSAAPEPSTWALMLAGIGGVGLALRRSKRSLAGQLRRPFAA